MKKAEKEMIESINKSLHDCGYNSIKEFIEIACAMSTLVANNDMEHAAVIAGPFSEHCGHVLYNLDPDLYSRAAVTKFAQEQEKVGENTDSTATQVVISENFLDMNLLKKDK